MDDFSEKDPYEGLSLMMKFLKKYILLPNAIQPQSKFMIFLVFIQWCAFMYNAWAIPLRFSFHIYQTEENAMKWAFADYSMDLVYLFDTIGKYIGTYKSKKMRPMSKLRGLSRYSPYLFNKKMSDLTQILKKCF